MSRADLGLGPRGIVPSPPPPAVGQTVVILPSPYFTDEWAGRSGVVEEHCSPGLDLLIRFPGGRGVFINRGRVEVCS